MMKKILLLIAAFYLLQHSNAAIVYQDSFDNDGLASNSGTGGTLTSNSIRQHSWSDNGSLLFTETANTNFQNRALVFTNNSFQSSVGFQLEVDFLFTNNGGASALSFGLIREDANLATYNGFHPYLSDTSVYSFGINTDTGNLGFTDASTVSLLDDGVIGTSGTSRNVILTIVSDGATGADWSWSLDGVSQGSGNIAIFDFASGYRFAAYGQDDQGDKSISSVTLSTIPEPSSLLLLGISFTAMLARRKRLS